MDKLREKKQTPFQQNQAAHTVSLYFETQVPGRSPGRAKTTSFIAPARPQSWCRWEDGYVLTSTPPEWDAVIAELAAQIKIRHWSRKMLKTYAH